LALGMWLGPGIGSAAAEKQAKGDQPAAEACGKYGTSVHFLSTPALAAKQAEKEEKLVFVLHVSGLFEDPGVT
jgi:hypothetical protein